MKIKTSELSCTALDWAAAKAEGALHPLGNVVVEGNRLWLAVGEDIHYEGDVQYTPSTDWAQGGPIIEREDIAISALPDGLCRAYAPGGTQWVPHGELGLEVFKWTHKQEGYTPLIAAMRCFVASKLGDEVDVPEELA